MFSKEQRNMLCNSGYFAKEVMYVYDNMFIGMSPLSMSIWKVVVEDGNTYDVYVLEEETWVHRKSSSCFYEIFGALSDYDDNWLYMQKKKRKQI